MLESTSDCWFDGWEFGTGFLMLSAEADTGVEVRAGTATTLTTCELCGITTLDCMMDGPACVVELPPSVRALSIAFQRLLAAAVARLLVKVRLSVVADWLNGGALDTVILGKGALPEMGAVADDIRSVSCWLSAVKG